MELYQLKMEMGENLHDHINHFNQLVCQLFFDEEQAMLLLASLPMSYKSLVQMLLVGKTSLKLDEVTSALRENERMMKNENINTESHVLVAQHYEQGRNNDGHRGRSNFQSRLERDMSNVQCYYCGKKANVIQNLHDDDDLYLATTGEVAKSKWIMDSAASKHICRDQTMFYTLKTNGEFGCQFKLRNGRKMEVKSIGTVRMKLHNGAIQTFENVRYVPSAASNIISLGELTSQDYRYVSSKWGCKVYKEKRLILQGQKNEKNIYYLERQVLRR
uniref:Retrovirus-related Pol polyprotein from transposon TNT 1-94 n=1 Tax=Cajanus cajan TaxID=3821 RepID=A0A151R7W3_CAJCA|nr:Retrovirus-related Pol polyprotein from transposon TNT 1-94 [Cajanus cajan]